MQGATTVFNKAGGGAILAKDIKSGNHKYCAYLYNIGCVYNMVCQIHHRVQLCIKEWWTLLLK